MHPFYEHSGRLVADRDTRVLGLVSMAAYLLFWAAAIPVALRALRRAQASVGPDGNRDPALEIVRARYARGEIDERELRERTQVLRPQSVDGVRRR